MFITNLFTVIPSVCAADPDLLQHRAGQARRVHHCHRDRVDFLGMDSPRSALAGDFPAQPRPCQPVASCPGHSICRIILTDILPYIASYVVMALILQISSGILAEAELSLLGLGPARPKCPRLGLMMNWAMIYQAHILGKWWAYLPRDCDHRADLIFDESDEHRSRPGVQPGVERIGDRTWRSGILEVKDLTTKYITRLQGGRVRR